MGLKDELLKIDSEVLCDQTTVSAAQRLGAISLPAEYADKDIYTAFNRSIQDAQEAGWSEERILGMQVAYGGLARVAAIQERST